MESQMQEAGIRQRLLKAAPGEWVLEYRDLAAFCQSKTPQGFGKWYEELCGRTEKELAAGRLNYPQAALEMMDAHQISERVNRKSLLEDTPAVIREFIEQMFVNNADI